MTNLERAMNVVNASDINEMTPNMLYVEGSMLDRFLDGDFCLSEVKSNRILVAANKPVTNETINAVNAARATIGAEIDIVALDVPLTMTAEIADGVATGDVGGYEALIDQIHGLRFDALAIHTPIAAPRDMTLNYYRDGGVNPWGDARRRQPKFCPSVRKRQCNTQRPGINIPIPTSTARACRRQAAIAASTSTPISTRPHL